MFSRIFLTFFVLLFATFIVVSNPLNAVAENHEDPAAEEPAKSDDIAENQDKNAQDKDADETPKPDEAAGDETPGY